MRKLLAALFAIALIGAVVFVVAGRGAGPSIQVERPEKFVGTTSQLVVKIGAPAGTLSSLRVTFEQNGSTVMLVDGTAGAGQVSGDVLTITRAIDRSQIPTLRTGAARITIAAARPALFGMRHLETQLTHYLEVRLEAPRLTVLSTHHYVNLGGAEMIVYRVDPHDVASGVRVGDVEYPGFPGAGLKAEGVSITDPSVRVAFFALLHDQALDTPMRVFARDEAGNHTEADFDRRTFPKPVKSSRIELPDAFLDRVVPAILAGTTDVAPTGTNLDKFLVINGELRRKNNAKIGSFARETSPELLWGGVVFHPFTSTAVQSAFADRRTYLYHGREVDHQTHLGFDLASFAGTAIVAANRGKVLFAGDLGIYGNTVIIDHGLGVQSLYAHLSSIGVKTGAMVDKAQEIGRSGMTGLAAGDHLHYTMLVSGHMVNPLEWWDLHWIDDRILRKLREVH